MANNFTVNISEKFNLQEMTTRILETYQSKGFNVRYFKRKSGVKITIEKGVGGINTLLGLGQGITITCSIFGKEKDTLSINFSDGDWMGTLIGCIAGWFLCFVPVITAVIGIIKQLNFQKECSNDIQMIACEDFEEEETEE